MNPRPDEVTRDYEIERDKDIRSNIKKGAKKIGGAVAGLGIADKISPFLSEFISPELALKGIGKISPRLGDVLKKGMDQGLSLKSGLDFLKENLPSKNKPENKMSNKNVLDQYSPELREFIEDKINKGKSPTVTAALAKDEKKFEPIIKQIISDHKLDNVFGFYDLIKSIYGSSEPKEEQAIQQESSEQIDPSLAQILQQGEALLNKFRNLNG